MIGDGNYPTKRHRPPRLPNHDYTTPGYYFVTFNASQRGQNILCAVNSPVAPAALGGQGVTLTSAGEIVQKLIGNIPSVYPDVRVDCYAIMPDHVHMIVVLGCQDGPPRAAGTTGTSLGRVVNAIKSLSSKQCGRPLWQRGYYDHVIRNGADLDETRRYIRDNPARSFYSTQGG